MHMSHARSYKSHIFYVEPFRAPGGKFQASFAVHSTGPDDVPAPVGSLRFEEWDSPELFDSEAEAIRAADVRARAWIDANPEEN